MLTLDSLLVNLSRAKDMCEQSTCREMKNMVNERFDSFQEKSINKRIEIITARDDVLTKITQVENRRIR